MPKPVLGAQLYTVRKHTQTIQDIAVTLRKIAGIGYTSIQISAFGPVDPKEVAKVLADTGLTVACTHFAWTRFQKDLDALIEEHRLWRCRHPAIGGLPGEYRTAEGLKRFLEEIPPIAERLAAAGMDFSYHNHSHELMRIGKTTWLEALYAQASPRHVKAEIDTYWIVHGGGDPVAWLRRCAGREPVVHFKDMIMTPEGQRMAEIGEGNLNWPDILKACQDGGVEYALIEQDECYGRDPFESLAISYRNLRQMGLK